MCRYYSDSSGKVDVQIAGQRVQHSRPPRYVIRTTNNATVITHTERGLSPLDMRWGFDIPKLAAVVNARAETAATKPMFRAAYRNRRCLVPACGFYESGPLKQPVRFTRHQGDGLLFAGLWSEFEVGNCFLILTTTANATVAQYHDRMPVILNNNGAERWLTQDFGLIGDLLAPAPDDLLTAYPVTRQVFKAGFDSPEALKPVPIQPCLI